MAGILERSTRDYESRITGQIKCERHARTFCEWLTWLRFCFILRIWRKARRRKSVFLQRGGLSLPRRINCSPMGHPGTQCGEESETTMAEALTKVGRCQILRELGRGSMGVVYQGYDPVIGRPVAIKAMLAEGLGGAEFQEYKARFQREAQAAGMLAHPNIVTVYDFGEDNGVLYLTMEYLEGKSLRRIGRRTTPASRGNDHPDLRAGLQRPRPRPPQPDRAP